MSVGWVLMDDGPGAFLDHDKGSLEASWADEDVVVIAGPHFYDHDAILGHSSYLATTDDAEVLVFVDAAGHQRALGHGDLAHVDAGGKVVAPLALYGEEVFALTHRLFKAHDSIARVYVRGAIGTEERITSRLWSQHGLRGELQTLTRQVGRQ